MPSRARPKPVLHRHFFREWREFRRLDQETAAERIGISRTQLSRIENMKSPYSQGLLQSAAYVYQCSEAELIERNPFHYDVFVSFSDKFRQASDADQRRLAAMIETFLKSGS